ncbi:very-long-chain 3-oxoacyl-CoA reductase-B-like [Anolis sagrei]|uniref:very-long-chain 3-oxoacyl-CoA reductase-B-like n=1 Tax=Anolis sagrei TaxID=38937 RepID=UPI003520ED05
MAPQGEMTSLDLSFCLLGGAITLWMLLKVSWFIWFKIRVHILSEYWKAVDFSHYGTWAVVTGATSGIGKAYAHELAKKGLDVVLVSRSMEKLKQVADEIEQLYGRRTKVIQADFTGGSEIYESIHKTLHGLEIGVLVNNVGTNQLMPLDFLRTPDIDKYINDVVNCNILSTLKMTEAILPQMVARKKGIIINLSSASAWRPTAWAALYSSSKAFVDFFSRALDVEYRSKGIIVQCVLPMFVDTNMTKLFNFRIAKMSPEVYAHKALNTVGFTNRTSGCLSHSLQSAMVEWFIPTSLLSTSYGQLMYRSGMKSLFK